MWDPRYYESSQSHYEWDGVPARAWDERTMYSLHSLNNRYLFDNFADKVKQNVKHRNSIISA